MIIRAQTACAEYWDDAHCWHVIDRFGKRLAAGSKTGRRPGLDG